MTALNPSPQDVSSVKVEHKTVLITNQPTKSPAGANPDTSCCMEELELLSSPQRAELAGYPISVYRDLVGWGETIIQSLSKYNPKQTPGF